VTAEKQALNDRRTSSLQIKRRTRSPQFIAIRKERLISEKLSESGKIAYLYSAWRAHTQ